MTDSARRFSGRVENYVRYRPGYPRGILSLLRTECGLEPDSEVADVGAGPGFLSRLFLENGNRVFGVEPNQEMREAGEHLLRDYPNFVSVDAAAEATTLDDRSVDFVTAGQAFHWFDAERARTEFGRVLKPGGWVVLVWNTRRTAGTPFLEAYEQLLQTYGTDYWRVGHGQGAGDKVSAFFEPGVFAERTFENAQVFDFEGIKGRLLSSSYVPGEGEPGSSEMLEELERIFREHEKGDRVSFEYDTQVYYGRLINPPAA